MGKLRKIIFYSMIPITLLCLAASLTYYQKMGLQSFERTLCAIDNTIKVFLARPSVQSYAAFKTMDKTYTQLERIVTYVYGFLIFAAPVMMTTAIVAGFSAYIFDFINSIRISFKDKMFVFGDAQISKSIASKYAKKYNVNYLMPAETNNEDRVPLLKDKVKAYVVDYAHISDECRRSKIEKASCVVLGFEDCYKSYDIITEIIEYLIKNSDKTSVPVYILDTPGVFHNVFNSTYAGLCQRNNKDRSLLKLLYINVTDANAKSFFKDPGMTVQPDNRHHIIIMGLSGYGRSMLKELIAYMEREKLIGTIEVFDHDIEHSMNNLAYAEISVTNMDNFYQVPVAKNAVHSVGQKTDAGTITYNYYNAQIGELKLTDYLTEIIKQGPITEYFCFVKDIEASFECFRLVHTYEKYYGNPKLYFRIESKFTNAFEAMKADSPNLEFIISDIPDIELAGNEDQ